MKEKKLYVCEHCGTAYNSKAQCRKCNGKRKGIFAPDGYAYSWDEDRKTEAAIRRIKALRKVKEESHA